MDDWISAAKAAEIVGVHRNTVRASLSDPERRAEWWGEENKGWRRRPLSRRGIFDVSARRAAELAGGSSEAIQRAHDAVDALGAPEEDAKAMHARIEQLRKIS